MNKLYQYGDLSLKKKKFFNHGKQNEKGRLRMTETLAKRHTKQSEKHVTVYLLENGFQVA